MVLPQYPTEPAARVQFIQTERLQVIQKLALQGKRAGAILDTNSKPQKSLFDRLSSLLEWLDETIQISPELKEQTKIEEGLRTILDERFNFPEEFKTKATALLEKLQTESWGRPARAVDSPIEVVDGEDGDEEDAGRKRKRRSSGPSPERAVIMPVPYDHPIWGRHGILHGLALKRTESGGKSKVLDPEYLHQKRNPKVYGHNDITVGRWFPYQLLAVFHGAHGTSQAGITPGPIGAYSVIVAGHYEDLDRDDGDVIFYSGSGAFENTDPGRTPKATVGTRSLHASIDSREPVRVLRSHSGLGSWAPTKGLRYNGLYRVVSYQTPKNMKGGLYERFRLERLEDQIPAQTVQGEAQRARSEGLRSHRARLSKSTII